MSESDLDTINKLVARDDKTNPDGSVDVIIEDWEETGTHVEERITVSFKTPSGDVETETMEFPQPGEDYDDYKFSRLVRSCGHSMSSADMIVGDTVQAQYSNGSWYLDVPESTNFTGTVENTVSDLQGKITEVAWRRVIIATFYMLAVLSIIRATFIVA